eukprot:INCI4876.1.p2 GENE.INCI4876.1~~INCI4876.1.p2  ORF type:complete len:126 (+),score=29.19 INCI4876.1:498-875(+)
MLRRIQLIREMAEENVNDQVLGPPKPPTPVAKFLNKNKLSSSSSSSKMLVRRANTGEFLVRKNNNNSKSPRRGGGSPSRSPRGMPRSPRAAARAHAGKKFSSARDERHPSVVDALDVAISQQLVK